MTVQNITRLENMTISYNWTNVGLHVVFNITDNNPVNNLIDEYTNESSSEFDKHLSIYGKLVPTNTETIEIECRIAVIDLSQNEHYDPTILVHLQSKSYSLNYTAIKVKCFVFTGAPDDVQIKCENHSLSINWSLLFDNELLVGGMKLFFNVSIFNCSDQVMISTTLTDNTTVTAMVEDPGRYCLKVAAVVQGSTGVEGQVQGNFSEATIDVIAANSK